jgi:6-phosphogluconolactonase
MGEAGMENNHYIFNTFDNRAVLVESLSKRIINNLNLAIKEKGFACLVLSGGSTPKKLLSTLSQINFAWEKVHVTLVDERWVDPSSQESNEKLVCDYLMQGFAKAINFLLLKNGAPTAKDGVKETEEKLKHFCDNIDIAILGMGKDAHTASFFPNTDELEFALTTKQLCCPTTATVEPKERITLSRSFLLQAKNLILHIEGREKEKVFEEASKASEVTQMPIIAMMQQEKPILEVYYAD